MRRATWILLLMLALLPLRGWAVASMGLPVPASSHAAIVQPDAMPAEFPVMAGGMPCHQVMADGAMDAGSTTCQACDACHTALGTAPQALHVGDLLPSNAPVVRVARDTGRPAIDGLERPPRSVLA
jgi:hypothetical protein